MPQPSEVTSLSRPAVLTSPRRGLEKVLGARVSATRSLFLGSLTLCTPPALKGQLKAGTFPGPPTGRTTLLPTRSQCCLRGLRNPGPEPQRR